MERLLIIKERFKEIYGKYDVYVVPAFRFIFAFAVMSMINSKLGYMARLDSIVVVFMISLICAFLPNGAIVAFGALMILGHIISLSLELAAIVLVVFTILLCGYFRFTPREGYLVALTPLLFALKVPYVIPVIAGLTMSIFSFIPTAIGVFVYYLVKFCSTYNKTAGELSMSSIAENIKYILDGLLDNKAMLVYMLVFAIAIIIINTIKKLSVDYAWAIAALIGTVANMIMLIIANGILDAKIGVLGIIFGNLLALVVAVVLYVMVFSGDYSRTERVQFEDDDYYYYVKAVPKFAVVPTDIKVKKINARKANYASSHKASKYSQELENTASEDENESEYEEIYTEE